MELPYGITSHDICLALAILNYALESDGPYLTDVNRVYLARTMPRILKGICLVAEEEVLQEPFTSTPNFRRFVLIRIDGYPLQ